jgi:hypothetical protein
LQRLRRWAIHDGSAVTTPAAVHVVAQPVQLPTGIGAAVHLGQQSVEDALLAPAVEAVATVFHEPYSPGRSRQGEPVRASHTIASTTWRWSLLGRPVGGRCGGSSGSRAAHWASVSSGSVRAMPRTYQASTALPDVADRPPPSTKRRRARP